MVVDDEYNRMRWAARRGMLELDLVLEPFVRDRYRDLGEDDRASFRRLMESEDQDLFAWFLGRQLPDDQELAAIVKTVLDFARTKPEDR
ncbi:succinate dehydrogenase assembly factor 2 family protein [Mangrovimicrobium sediminis]|uniref:FAD assembly factor SdhE n=1 Tax=Mangrovimicrobium sediminis TaxID=2562682 RepID=A0A4Z0M593_9GAMM|nr:succinate dehydrogenase assembly factor 2 [Haliea sp. SAOS-164]TGD74654.1 succinate dehydrogenase assembly factor 2 family protein [Haliea sp. SAOS-164]